MTVVVGIYCSDGIVVAADSALTISGVVEQEYHKKIACFDSNLMVGFAGDLGFAQRFRQVIKDIWNTNNLPILETVETHQIIKEFCSKGIMEFLSTQRQDAPINIPSGFILGFVHKGKHSLINLPAGGFQPLVINENLPFCSIGSGHFITNPFLSFIKDVFWGGKSIPTVSVGIFSAIMALKLAIQVNAGGINSPIHVGVIEKKREEYKCRMLHEDEISQHESNYNEAVLHFASYKHIFDRANIADAPAIPKPPNISQVVDNSLAKKSESVG
jgi:20S proteasome alpha/beta subunit